MLLIRIILIMTVISIVPLLSSCNSSTELYSNLHEKEANAMIAVLLDHKINADKQVIKSGVSIFVPKGDLSRAVNVLNKLGYPKDKFENIGQIFRSDKLVSSPTEEQIRFSYAISQSLSETISNIDGVITSRVHVVFNKDKSDKKASASVFIKHMPVIDFNKNTHKIKTLIVNSVPNLAYEKISVILFPADYSG